MHDIKHTFNTFIISNTLFCSEILDNSDDSCNDEEKGTGRNTFTKVMSIIIILIAIMIMIMKRTG